MDFPFYLVIVWLVLVFAIVVTTIRIAAKQKKRQSGSVARPIVLAAGAIGILTVLFAVPNATSDD